MKQKTTVKLFTAGLMVLLGIALVACGGDKSGSTASDGGEGASSSTLGADGKYHIRIANVAASAWALEPLCIGIEKGFFEEANVVIEDQGPVDVFTQLSLLEAGNLDIINNMESDAIAAVDVGSKIIGIASSDIASKKYPHMAYVVLEDSPYQEAADLVGETVGLGGTNGCSVGFLYEYLRQGGVTDPFSNIEYITAAEPALLEALRKGEVAVAGIHGNTNKEVLKGLYPDLRVLFDDYDILEDRGGGVSWYALREWAEADPDRTTAFISAIAKTNNWINDNPEEAGELYKTLATVEVNEDTFVVRAYGKDGLINPAAIETWLDILSTPDSFQPLKNTNLTFDNVATNRYNPHAEENR
jgi:ABC-type nitrate/sulfonate/bicarbonate transport system substrate-binding protein